MNIKCSSHIIIVLKLLANTNLPAPASLILTKLSKVAYEQKVGGNGWSLMLTN